MMWQRSASAGLWHGSTSSETGSTPARSQCGCAVLCNLRASLPRTHQAHAAVHKTHAVQHSYVPVHSWTTNLSAVQIAVVGGGPGGVELALALQNRLHQDRVAAGRSEDSAPEIR